MRKSYTAAALAVAVVLIIVFVGPGLLGRVAHARIDKDLDELGGRAPYLQVVDHSWTPGWFTSGLVVTLEFIPAGLGPQAAGTGLAGLPPKRFTVRSELLHGPLLGTSGMGLVRIKSHVVLGDEIRAKFVEFLGTDEPVHLTTRLGLFGGATLTLAGEGRTVKVDASGANPDTLAWDDFKLVFSGGSGGKSYDVAGRQPRIEFSDAAGSSHVLLAGLRLEGDGRRVTQDLYDGKMQLAIGSLRVKKGPDPPLEVNDLRYDVASIAEGDYFKYVFKLGTGAVKYAALDATGLRLKEVHYDFTLGHLHVATLQKMMEGFREASAHGGGDDPEQRLAAMMGLFREQGVALLAHDPELTIDRIGIVTPEGELALKGSLRLVGVGEADVSGGVAGLVQHIAAELDLDTVQAVVEKFPNGAAAVGVGTNNGFLKREGTRLSSHLEFRDGKLSVNGKPVPLPPGLAGQPPAGR
jgi:uncharacterized protein YdgA (DUF945 family)